MNFNKKGFTLVELIVVITILAILGTIAFLSLQGYSKKSRNSVRSIDVGVMKQSLWIFVIESWKYPQPDNAQNISYSWVTVFSQWVFWDNVMKNLWDLSHKPVDPQLEIEYNYSVSQSRNKYQLWWISEGDLYWYQENDLISQSYTLSNNEVQAFVSWEFNVYDLKIQTGSTCYTLAIPSMMITNPPWDWELVKWSNYKFSYNTSLNIPINFLNQVETPLSWVDFTISEVLNTCSVNTLPELNTYISKLSLAYQPLSGKEQFDEIIFNSLTTPFQIWSIVKLQENWIKIWDWLLEAIYEAAPDNIFFDTFGTDGALSWHIPDTLWSRTGSDLGSYTIIWNMLEKTSASLWGVTPLPNPSITSENTFLEFTAVDFAWWNINIYSRYEDATKHYLININTWGYTITRNNSWSTTLSSISETIPNNSLIKIVYSWPSIELLINGISKSFNYDNSVNAISTQWKLILELENNTAKIDDYKLLYK